MKFILQTIFANKNRNIAALLLAFIFALTNVMVQPIFYRGSLDMIISSQQGVVLAVFQTIGLTVAIFIGLSIILAYGTKFFNWLDRFNPLKKLSMSWKKSSVLILAGIILLFWLPWIIIYFPGSMPYDPVAQIYQTHGSGALRPEIYEPTTWGWISNTHPILHTLILGGFFELGNALGSQNLGIFMYTIFQCILRALCFAVACCYLRRINVPKIFCLLSLAFFALFPAISSSSAVVFKDHVYSPIYLIYLIFVIEMVLTKGKALQSRKFIVGFTISAVLMALLKHPGIYIVLVSGIWLLIIYRKQWKALLAPILTPTVIVWLLFPLLVFPALNVIPAGSQEMMGPFLQQTARVLKDNPDAMSQKDIEILDRVVPYRIAATNYNQYTSDFIKGNYRQNATRAEQLAYFGLWFRQAFQYPIEYFEGFATIEDSFLVPLDGWEVFDNLPPGDHKAVIDVVGHNNLLPSNHTREVKEELDFGSIEALYPAKMIMRGTFLYTRTVPVIGFFYSIACYTFYFPLIFFAVLLLNKRRYLPVFIPVLLTFLVLMISPMAMARYALPMLETTPLLFGLTILAFIKSNQKDAENTNLLN